MGVDNETSIFFLQLRATLIVRTFHAKGKVAGRNESRLWDNVSSRRVNARRIIFTGGLGYNGGSS